MQPFDIIHDCEKTLAALYVCGQRFMTMSLHTANQLVKDSEPLIEEIRFLLSQLREKVVTLHRIEKDRMGIKEIEG